MPTKRIGDIDRGPKSWGKKKRKVPCFDPEHDPPNHRVFDPGIYEHTCPRCGQKTVFTVRGPLWGSLSR